MLTDFFISIAVTFVLTIIIYRWFGNLGFSSFPVLTFLVVSILSYAVTAGVHILLLAL